jgi:hypothetical protein
MVSAHVSSTYIIIMFPPPRFRIQNPIDLLEIRVYYPVNVQTIC